MKNNASKASKIQGFPVLVLDGKEVSPSSRDASNATRKLNGPHTSAKWAQRLLGTDYTASERRERAYRAAHGF
jgi:hypothetical protein